MLDMGEQAYYIDSLAQAKGVQKIIYNICNDILGRDKNLPLPPYESNKVLANWCNTYFGDKISKIHKDLESTLDTSICDPYIYDDDLQRLQSLALWSLTSKDLVKAIKTFARSMGLKYISKEVIPSKTF